MNELVHDRTIERTRTRPSFSVRGRHKISKKNSTGFRSISIGWDKEKNFPRRFVTSLYTYSYARFFFPLPIDETEGKRDRNGNEFFRLYIRSI